MQPRWALMIDPQHACQNLLRLRDENRLGAYGFYEAVDFNPSRVPRGESSVTVRSFMAHHQAMSLLSLLYVLRDRPMQRRFESEPAFRATELLLQERVPKTPSVFPHPAEVSQARGLPAEPQANLRVFDTPHTAVPEVHLLSNGRYHVAISAAGGGIQPLARLSVTRWHEDPTRDCWGTFLLTCGTWRPARFGPRCTSRRCAGPTPTKRSIHRAAPNSAAPMAIWTSTRK